MSVPDENTLTAYKELCTSYRAIDDFRAKLLGFLPLATGGIFLLIAKPEEFDKIKPLLTPIGFFGFAIALGLFCFELYGTRKCHRLIQTGKELECLMGKTGGQFSTRPDGILGLINEPFAAGIIYPAVLAAWIYLAFYGLGGVVACLGAIVVFAAGFFLSLKFINWLINCDKLPKEYKVCTEEE